VRLLKFLKSFAADGRSQIKSYKTVTATTLHSAGVSARNILEQFIRLLIA
jgi:hypothetical protein